MIQRNKFYIRIIKNKIKLSGNQMNLCGMSKMVHKQKTAVNSLEANNFEKKKRIKINSDNKFKRRLQFHSFQSH